MLPRRGPCHPRRQDIQVPQLSQERQDTGMRVLAALVTALVLHNALAYPRRDDEGRHADSQAGEVERDVLAVGGLLSIGEAVTSGDVFGWRNVVREAAVLV